MRRASDPTPEAARDIGASLTALLADLFALHLKTKNFQWHILGPHFHAYHRMLEEQAGQVLAATDIIAERVRKLGTTTLRSIGHVARLQRIQDSDADHLTAPEMLAELCDDNRQLAAALRSTYRLCAEHGDVASASLLAAWIDAAEGRVWGLHTMSRTS
jgi:starvation-inducible DNA-binding protein